MVQAKHQIPIKKSVKNNLMTILLNSPSIYFITNVVPHQFRIISKKNLSRLH